jgi:hypothetical protein
MTDNEENDRRPSERFVLICSRPVLMRSLWELRRTPKHRLLGNPYKIVRTSLFSV